LKKENYLENLSKSKKPFIIYKSDNGFDVYSDFSTKIILTNKNINTFINKITLNKFKNKKTDLYIGFFGYEILNNLINVKLPKQKGLKFPKGIFYKPETKVNLNKKLEYNKNNIIKNYKNFKVNINKNSYKNIFNKFKKKLNQEKHIKLKFVQNITINQKLILLIFFVGLQKQI